MELGQQIKKYRMEKDLSQEELADKIYVSRQTISNWETGKSYPDVKSLLLLSGVFNVSLDILIKGDLEEMKETIKSEEMKAFGLDSKVFAVLLLASIIMPVPLLKWFGVIGVVGIVLLLCVTLYYAMIIERKKKQFDVQSYKEIVAFMEGKYLEGDTLMKEKAVRPYQKVLLALSSGLITLCVTLLLLNIFFK